VIACASEAEVGRGSSGPDRHGAALRGADLVEVSPAWERGLLAAAVVGVGQIFVGWAGAIGVLLGLEWVWIVEAHVGLHGGGEEGENRDSLDEGWHLCCCFDFIL